MCTINDMTYEYECQHCGHKFEAEQKISDDTLTNCPQCNGQLKRLISSNASFVLKGTGWYSDGYSPSSDTKNDK